jgi:hypothetical protein
LPERVLVDIAHGVAGRLQQLGHALPNRKPDLAEQGTDTQYLGRFLRVTDSPT